MRSARSWSFSQVTCRSTMRFPCTLPSRTMAPVVMVLSTSFVAVPAFIRVDPVTTSGPDERSDDHVVQGHQLGAGRSAEEEARTCAAGPRAGRARPCTYGRRAGGRDAEDEVALGHARARPSAARAVLRARPPRPPARTSASSPPAITPRTIAGSVPKVGGISAASSTPSRARGAGTHVDEAAARSERVFGRARRPGRCGLGPRAHGLGHAAVFRVDQIDDVRAASSSSMRSERGLRCSVRRSSCIGLYVPVTRSIFRSGS